MITIDAIGKNGQSILPDLAGSSPTGGQVTTGSRRYRELSPGDVIRGRAGYWAVVTDVRHNGIHGLTTFAAIEADGTTTRRTVVSDCSGERRTDAQIDPGSLWKLADLAGKVSLVKTYVPALAMAS